MTTKGIRIDDSLNNVVSVDLKDILEAVHNGNELKWSILFLDAYGFIGGSLGIPDFEQIRLSEKGLFISWDELKVLATRFEQIIDLHLIGAYDSSKLHRYKNERECYETCDVDIVMFDSSYWEVFSQDESLIQRLENRFKDTLLLMSDFQEAFYNE